MWGSRKKKDEEYDTNNENLIPKSFDLPKQRADIGVGGHSLQQNHDGMNNNLENMMNMYLKMMEELLESEDFDKLVNPESIRLILDQFPAVNDIPELSALLNSEEFNNPIILKNTIKDGVKLLKSSSSEIISFLTDPEKISELTKQLPPEIRNMLQGLTNGDFSGIKDIISTLPGLDDSQKSMLSGLIDGNSDVITKELKKVLGDDSQIEAARQQFLLNPEMAESMGIPMELLHDPVLWAQTMAKGMEALSGGGIIDHEDENEVINSKKFGKFSRAA